ncbi:hypothetical protein [Nocardioides hwasunensis]|uniref:Uncharacterized protein n=1 Tax=Nocardioides hwasunensis TaxID=397258 RepID=A0ABR8MGK9_9ACTN|nr:hypothetical protein [Nocardioides hwasunensis]MBD3915208.1 hypothetical protein [Nocardioides hwasunensis]
MSTTRRLAANLTTVALLGLTPIALAPPSRAAATVETFTIAAPSATVVEYGSTFDIDVDLDSASGTTPTKGVTTLLALPAGGRTWVPVATATSTGGDFLGVTPALNTTYKVAYAGYTPTGSSSTEDTYSPSESDTFVIGVARTITHPTSGFVLKGTVAPEFGKKKITIRASKSRKRGFKPFRTIKTTRTGSYRTRLPARDGTWYWKVSVRGDSRFRGNGYVWKTEVFHRSATRAGVGA